jgi:predicted O-methyltransferase YrrM
MPSIALIEDRLPKGSRVFEWGSGASTSWFSAAGCEVVSCEHDPEWAKRNPEVIFRPLDDGYVEEIANHEPFDMVLIDGRRRVDCMRAAHKHLTPRGVIVLDNSERPRYEDGIAFLRTAGFRHVPFTGIAPGALKRTTTSVFYRDGNCLDL